MWSNFPSPVTTLRLLRVRIGKLDLGMLAAAEWRKLYAEERKLLFQ